VTDQTDPDDWYIVNEDGYPIWDLESGKYKLVPHETPLSDNIRKIVINISSYDLSDIDISMLRWYDDRSQTK
jgi:hypothetical protein